jgi:hypothetical protein
MLDICDTMLARLGRPLVDDIKAFKRREQAKLRMRRMRAKGKK